MIIITALTATATVLVVLALTLVELFDKIAPALGVIVPIIVAFAVRYQAPKTVKFGVSVVITAGVAVASIALQDWSTFTAALLTERLFMLFGEAQVVYFVVSRAVERWVGAESINELKVFRPGSGIG